MKSVKELRQKEADRQTKRTLVYSTSEGRANFAEALESAQVQNAVVGFDRYGRPVAALVPIDAVRMLAGLDKKVEPATREKIRRMAQIFLQNVPEKAVIDGYHEEERDPEPAKKKAAPRAKLRRG